MMENYRFNFCYCGWT